MPSETDVAPKAIRGWDGIVMGWKCLGRTMLRAPSASYVQLKGPNYALGFILQLKHWLLVKRVVFEWETEGGRAYPLI